LNIQLSKGLQSYIYDDIPTEIEANSLIFKANDHNLRLISQNYEYDLAWTSSILRKYLNKPIEIVLKDKTRFSGQLNFFDDNSCGIQDNETKEFQMINKSEIVQIRLSELPDNFYIKPSLKWQLDAPKTGQYPLEISYITHAINWFVTYNVVLDKNKMRVSPWVTLENQSGKSYKNICLKLIAGDLNKEESDEDEVMAICAIEATILNTPAFSEKAFADYHLYTLDQNVSINDNQIKQMALFDTKTVDYQKFYDYTSFSTDVFSKIRFKNSEQTGLGLPLPKGIVKMYLADNKDNNPEFAGEDHIKHTPLDQEVELKTGKAFDVIAKTTVLKESRSNQGTDYELSIVIENKKNEDIELRILHRLYNGNYIIINNNFDYTEKDADSIYITRNIKAGATDSLFWTQREKH